MKTAQDLVNQHYIPLGFPPIFKFRHLEVTTKWMLHLVNGGPKDLHVKNYYFTWRVTLIFYSYESATSNASPSLDFFSFRWIVKKEYVFSGDSLKKSKHHCDINFINGVNSSSFSSGLKLFERNVKVSEILFSIWWSELKSFQVEGGRGCNRISYFDSFLLIKFFFKALGAGQVKDVKQRWYPITIRNAFAIISLTSLYSWISSTMLMTGRWILFFTTK